ncbi:hypothetical protein EBS02_08535 [bacterium]|nr:hypothetical protein [bacterium]
MELYQFDIIITKTIQEISWNNQKNKEGIEKLALPISSVRPIKANYGEIINSVLWSILNENESNFQELQSFFARKDVKKFASQFDEKISQNVIIMKNAYESFNKIAESTFSNCDVSLTAVLSNFLCKFFRV